MQIPDLINSCFETFGGLAVWYNVWMILRHKSVKGVSVIATSFFAVWSGWNMYYYPHLGQWMSFTGATLLLSGEMTWVWLAWGYKLDMRKVKRRSRAAR